MREIVGRHRIIAVDIADPVALCLFYALIARSTDSTIRAVEGMDTRVFPGISITDVTAAIGAAIIDEQAQAFVVSIRLRQDAVETCRQVCGRVIDWDDDRD